jgi:hypothetical protein
MNSCGGGHAVRDEVNEERTYLSIYLSVYIYVSWRKESIFSYNALKKEDAMDHASCLTIDAYTFSDAVV